MAALLVESVMLPLVSGDWRVKGLPGFEGQLLFCREVRSAKLKGIRSSMSDLAGAEVIR